MMKILLLTIFLILADVQSRELIFDEEFKTLNFSRWQHEITLGGGGNWEFEYYTNNRTNSFVTGGILYLQPTLTADNIGYDQLFNENMNIWGGSPADLCTSNAFYGCERTGGAGGNILNPIQSARIRSVESFSFTYGTVEIRAKLPKGDWIWPAMWLLPKYNAYGQWPASGEIDLVESRGNSNNCDIGSSTFGSTLHWGPGYPYDAWEQAHKDYTATQSLSDAFHVYKLVWTPTNMQTYIDDTLVLDFKIDQDMFSKGGFPKNLDNPWQYETSDHNAPFDQEFYFIFNVAVGGTNGYFPDGKCGKPWTNTDEHAVNVFYQAKNTWYPTWNYPETHDSALQIDYVKVYSLDEEEMDVDFEFLNN